MCTVHAGSRLHFGLIHLAADGAPWPDRQGRPALPSRRFGGVGLMIDAPALSLRAEPADVWSATGALADRALAFAHRFAASFPDRDLPPHRLVIDAAPPEHAGLGSGTQLALATALALAASRGLCLPPDELARRVGRGRRSALGTHGFAAGGLLVEAGQGPAGGLSPLVARFDFPEDWRVVVVLPDAPAGLHGIEERDAIGALTTPPEQRDALCRLVLLGMLPALVERDLPAFGEALHDFNARAGEVFAAAQGGPYAGPASAAWVAFLRGEGVAGVGQSSWGPGVFAVVEDEDRARALAARARGPGAPGAAQVHVTRARDRGATVAP
jgi:beta-RFAP synthase